MFPQSSELALDKVSFSWPNGLQVIKECSFSIPHPGLWMLIGSNGSGKSTLFKLIAGMLTAQRGQIYCKNKALLMFQNPDHQLLLPTCRTDLLLSLSNDLSFEERSGRVIDALEQVGLKGFEDRPIHTLSGGQKQRLSLAGALVSKTNLLLLDEPTALLDPASQTVVVETVKKLTQLSSAPITALWITHRLEELQYSDGAAIMEKGSVGKWFPGKTLFQRLKPLAGSTG